MGSVWIIWSVLLALFVIIEVVTPQMTTIWLALGSLVSLLIWCVFPELVWVQIAAFVVVSAVSLAFTRKFARKIMKGDAEKTNADRCIGQQAVVAEEINNLLGKGQVNIKGVIWTARSSSDDIIPEGTLVTVEKIEGVKVIVKTK